MLENIRLSFQGIWSHKMRSFLTMLGIIIGIASIISIVSTIRGTNEQIKNNLIGAGNNNVKIQLYYQEGEDWLYDFYAGIPEGVPLVNESILTQIKDLDNVEAVSAYNRRFEYDSRLYYKDTSMQGCEIYGINDDYFPTCGYKIKKGRDFVPKDYNSFRPVMIIDSDVVSNLFPSEDPIGKIVEYRSIAFTIIGVTEEKTKFEPVINSREDYDNFMINSSYGRVFIPETVWPEIFYYDEPQELTIKTANTEAMSRVGKEAAEILNSFNTNTTVQYKGDNLLQKAKDLQDLSSTTNQQLIWIAGISLIVGGIGVMNIMLVSVTERTREIGIKKAIGAQKSRILWQFLTEASVLTSIGGLIGIIAGIGISQIISNITKTPVAISVPAIILAFAFSTIIGVVFGLLPSVKAANLNPIEALRHE